MLVWKFLSQSNVTTTAAFQRYRQPFIVATTIKVPHQLYSSPAPRVAKSLKSFSKRKNNMEEERLDNCSRPIRRSPRTRPTSLLPSSSPLSDPFSVANQTRATSITPTPRKRQRLFTSSTSSSSEEMKPQYTTMTILPETPASMSSPSKILELVTSNAAYVADEYCAIPLTFSSSSSSSSKRSTRTSSSGKKKKNKNDDDVASQLTSLDVARVNPNVTFLDLELPATELRPSVTLTTGQCFHWQAVETINTAADEVQRIMKKEKEVEDSATSMTASSPTTTTPAKSAWGIHNAVEWVGTLRISPAAVSSFVSTEKISDKSGDEDWNEDSIVVVLRETSTTTLYRVLYAPRHLTPPDIRQFLYHYFQVESQDSCSSVSLERLYQIWSRQCPRLRQIAACLPGVRIVDQDPFECLISFICSSNNNIPRITKMLAAIRREYGRPLVRIPIRGDVLNDEEYVLYSFPSLSRLAQLATEADLRNKCGLGYRAKYVMETLKLLQSLGGEAYLQELRAIQDPVIVQEKLCQFLGVGRKVADCVALFSLQQDNAIPVDVHVWDIARRDYDIKKQLVSVKSLTPTVYKLVGDLFRERFREKAGWAHSLLFVAELPSFRAALTPELIREMEMVCIFSKIACI